MKTTTFPIRRAIMGLIVGTLGAGLLPAALAADAVWQSRDVGDVAASGTASESGGSATVTGSGADIWNLADEFHYRYQALSGDAVLTARVTGLGNTNGWAKAALMFRETLAANSRHAMMVVSSEHGTAFQYRAATGGETASTAPTEAGGVPRWLRIVRAGNTFTGYESTDGASWTQRGAITIAGLPPGILVGLAVTSHNDGVLCTATFDTVTVAGALPPPSTLVAPSDLTALATTTARIDLNWRDHSSDETGFAIERSTDGTNFTALSAVGANITSFADTNAIASTTYHYRVYARRNETVSGYSNVASATSPAVAAPTDFRALGLPNELALSWRDNSTNETGFVIEWRGTYQGAQFGVLVTLPANTTQYSWTGLGDGGAYEFRIKAIQGSISSAYANTFGTVPTTPMLSFQGVTDTSISLRWEETAVSKNGPQGGPYSLERSLDGIAFSEIRGGIYPTGYGRTDYTDYGLTPQTTYYYRVRHLSSWSRSPYSRIVSGTTTLSPVGTPQSQDIGTTTTGNTSEANGRITVTGSGNDIWNTADGFRYRYQPWTGDGEIIARVTGLTDTNGWAKAGVMFRESTAAGSRHVSMVVSIAHGTALQYRLITGGESASSAPTEAGGVPRWVRLVRSGSTFTGYESSDGVTWALAGTVTLNAPTSLLVGLAVTSHNDGTLCTATFENVSLTGGSPPPPAPPSAPTNPAATATSSSQINFTWTDASNNESGFEVESSTDNTSYARLTTTVANVTSYSHTGLTAGTTYFYRVRAVNAAGNSSYTVPVSTTTSAAPPPIGSWQSQDIGAVAAAGRTEESGSSVLLTGSGDDIWNEADEFRYRYQPWTGDGEIITRVTTLSDTHGWAKAGLMFRETLNPNSRHASMLVSSAHGTAFQYRAVTGGASDSSAPSESGGVPRWLRLVRTGNTFTGYASTDGTNWTQAGTRTLDLAPTIYVGLAVTSHNDGVLCTATFATVDLRGGSPPPSGVNPPSGLSAAAISGTQVTLRWADNSTNETAFQVERSTDNVTFALLTSVATNTTEMTDATVSAGTTYYYRVRAIASGQSSSYSNTASVTTPGAWSQADIGDVGAVGFNDTPSINSIRIAGSGADIWDTADAFRYVYRGVTGDFVVEANVSSMSNTDGWAKAGVMIREAATPNARNVFVFVTPGHGVVAQERATDGGATTATAGPWWVNTPYWVRLVRTGNRFVAFSSPDGSNWTQFAAFDVTMGTTVQVGFAVTSHNYGVLNTATFVDPSIH